MTRSFTMSRIQLDDAQRAMVSLVEHTGCESEAATILGCIERLGPDLSILRYEMTPRIVQRYHRGTAPVVWSVRAVRADADR